MSAIPDAQEPWAGHSGLEVESFIKQQLAQAFNATAGKFGYVEMSGTDLRFYETPESQSPLYVISLGGDVYSIDIQEDAGQVFYILADEAEKLITISASTMVSPFGSTEKTPYPEAYSYVVAVNTGGGYVNRISGNIEIGGSATFDIRPFVATGDNYIRISVTGLSSGQVKTTVLTGTLTTLTLSANHAWQNVWNEDSAYTITGIRFAGSVQKVLHVAIDGVEQTPAPYGPNQSYTTTSTTYQLPASAFPAASGNGVHEVTLWMTAGAVSTQVITYHILCVAEGDTTPMVAINDITKMAVNFTTGDLFGYAVYNADRVVFNLNTTIGGQTYRITPQGGVAVSDRVEGQRYSFSYAIEVDTGMNTAVLGTMTATAASYNGSTHGADDTMTTQIDNTYSYIATPGALFYMNAANRDNGAADYQSVTNEMGASQDGNFAASYPAVWSGFSWTNDGWSSDPAGYRALAVPAGASVTVTDFAPLFHVGSYPQGLTVEMMLQCASPAEYDTPVFQMFDNNAGIKIYPTKISVFGSLEGNEVLQSVNFSENKMTHIAVTFTKNYEGVNTRNLVSVYINGISNVNFAFSGSSIFGSGPLIIGQPNTDAYLYKMRVYGQALEPRAVFNNFLNCIVDNVEFNRRQQYEANDIIEGGTVDYEACKRAGYNTMVVIMDDDSHPIPSFNNQASYDGCTLKFEYADHPTWNVTVGNVSLDGQGTTSKQYFRWNLRAKTNSSTTWTYGDETSETGKEGYFAGRDRVRVDRITAKKNYASSMQGHKMGMTGLYNDLYKQLGLGAELPNPESMVAVYQYPFVGFKYNAANDTYEFIGLYTTGPDKGSKVTFGYASSYNSLLSLEGPNHAPRGTRFITPWVDVTYSYQDETLKYGGEEGWDCDYVGGGLSSDKASDAAAILALYESEWKPAYDLVYHCSPYIAKLSDTGYASVAAINADIINFLAGSTDGVSNQILSFYDSNYDLVFFRTSTGQFDYLTAAEGKSQFNIKTYLGLTGSPTTAQIKAARAAKFKAEMENYWSLDQTLYHYCYCILFGVTDNFAKNSYPFKFLPYNANGAGNRWGWRQDDLDTVLMTDNNGRNTKSYSVEHGDLADGVEIFQGGESALWVLIRDNYQTEIRQMMIDLARAADALAVSLSIQGDGLHNSMYNLVSYYCWEHSSKYFAATLYENDRRWSYLEPWLINAGAVYNNVPPLTQALGDQFQAESLWVQRRITYIFSKYRVGAFTGDTAGYGRIAFTLAQSFTFHVTPAIDLYPVISLANTRDVEGGRTMAGQSATMYIDMQGSGGTTSYVHGADWLASLGDLSKMVLTSRDPSGAISFSILGARIQSLKIGDEVASNVDFNATDLEVSSPTITTIDARNVTTFLRAIDLMNCPRLTSALFGGSSAPGLTLPKGAKLTEVSFPATASLVFMHSLPFLQPQNLSLPSYAGIQSLCINNCPNFNPLAIARDVINTPNSQLQNLTLVWRDTLVASSQDIDALFDMTNLRGYIDDDANVVTGNAWIEGPLSSNEEISSVVYAAIEDAFPKIELDFDLTKVYIEFADPAVEAIALANWDTITDDNRITLDEARKVTTIGTLFRAKTNITSFDEFRFFTGVTFIPGGNASASAFYNSTNLTSIHIPKSVVTIQSDSFVNCTGLVYLKGAENVSTIQNNAFNGCSSLKEINFPALTSLQGYRHFQNNTSLQRIVSLGSITGLPDTAWDSGSFMGCTSLTDVNLPTTLTNLGSGTFRNCSSLESIAIPDGVTRIGHGCFTSCTNLTNINIPTSVTSLGNDAFSYTAINCEVNLPNLTSVGYSAFKNTAITKIVSLGKLVTLTSAQNQGTFSGCTSLTEVHLPETLVTVQVQAFLNCTGINTTIALPASLRTVGNSAFENCNQATFTGFENLTTIGAYAFIYTFPENSNSEIYLRDVTSLAIGAFRDTCIKKVTIGPNLAVIDGGANAGCFRYQYRAAAQNSLEEVVIEGNSLMEIGSEFVADRTSLTKINLPTSIAVIGNSAFRGTSITNIINLPNLTSLGSDAFNGTKITKVENLGTISVLNGNTFNNCSELTEVTLPATLTAIYNYNNFNTCPKLEKVNLLSTSVPTFSGSGFDSDCRIMVVPNIIKQYYTATNWITRSYRIYPLTGNNPLAIISGLSFRYAYQNCSTYADSNYSVTFAIEVPNTYHPLTISTGFTYDGTSGHEIIIYLDQNFKLVTWENTTASTRTININNANVKYIRLTIKTSELANCYIHDDTDDVYLWRGSDVTTIYE